MSDIIKDINTEFLKPNGFLNKTTDSDISFVDGTRTFTIEPSGDYYVVYINGVGYDIDSNYSVVIPDLEGLHIIYFGLNVSEEIELKSTQVFSDSIILDDALVSILYWDADNNEAIYVGEERHGLNMNRDTHFYLHGSQGTQIRTYPELGFNLDNFSVDGDGSSNAHAQFSIDDGEIFDEDLYISIEDGNPQDLSPILYAPVYYRSGANGYWRRDDATAYPVKRFGTSRLAFNEWTGTTWQQTEVTNEWFVGSLIVATSDITEPIKVIQGCCEYETVGKAKSGLLDEIRDYLLSDSFAVEEVPIGFVLYQTATAYTNAVKAKTVSQDSNDFLDFRSSDKKDLTTKKSTVVNNLTINGGLTFGQSLNPPTITTSQAPYNPAGLFDYVLIRIQASTTVQIKGLPQPDPIEVRVIEFKNYGTKNITFVNNSGDVAAEERFDFDNNKVLGPKGGLTVRYDDIDLKWFLTGAVL